MDVKTLDGYLKQVKHTGEMKFTRFLDPAEAASLTGVCKSERVLVTFYGGYEEAERQIAALSRDEIPEKADFPLLALESHRDTRFAEITHRDVLGAFMALGLTRDCIGDIIITDDRVILFALSSVSSFICESFTSAGRVKLSFHPMEGLQKIPEPSGTYFRGTVSSMRLDAMISEAFRISRGQASQMIRAGHVKLNHVICERVDEQVKEGNLLSLAGNGRVSVRSFDGLTKKQRYGITFFRYT